MERPVVPSSKMSKTTYKTKQLLLLIPMLAFSQGGCGGSSGREEPGVDASGGEVLCNVQADILPDLGARTVSGIGNVECDAQASLAVETCVQWNPSGTFEDIQCVSETKSRPKTLELANLSSCGLGAGRRFRSRVSVTVNGIGQPEVVSEEVACE